MMCYIGIVLSGTGHRLSYRLYPNGRTIWSVYDGHSGIDDAISRTNKLCEDNSGTPGTAIVQYIYDNWNRLTTDQKI